MNEKGIDMDIPDNLEEEDFLIIYKGRKSIEDSNEEEIVEIKTSKDDFIRKFRYFKKKLNELEHKHEIFIHDRFCTVTFKNAVDSLRSKKVEVCKDNCMELLSLSKKYEYDEMASTINKFIDERPDLDEIITSLLKTDKDKRNEYRESDGDSEDSEDSEESENIDETEQKKEELIAGHLDFFLERGALRNMSTFRLFRILNSPHRVVNNHHMLFEFIKNEQNTRKNSRNRKDNKYLDMLIGTLDYSEMSIDEIEYIVQSEYYTPVFEPRHRENAIKNLIDHIKHDELKMKELDLKIKTLEKVLQTQNENIVNNELKHRQKEAEQTQQISKLDDCIKESIEKITQKVHLIEQNNLEYQNEQEEKMKIFQENNDNDIKNIKQNIDKLKINIQGIESKSMNEHEKNQQQLSEENLLHKIKIEKLIQKIEKINKDNKREHEEIIQKQLDINASYQNSIKELRKRVETIEKSNKSNTIKTKSIVAPKKITAKIGKLSNGLLSNIKKWEKSQFNHLFIASQSSNDIYNLIDPNTNDMFCLNDTGKYIEIELQEPVDITGIKIFSSTSYYPKAFDIEIDDKLIKRVDNANELNGDNRSMTVSIDSKKSRRIKIINRGSSWDNDSKIINISRIEILSSEMKYSRGFFSTLLYQTEDHDPHKCPVFLYSSCFDLNTFTSIDPPGNICTYNEENSWFQIEFIQGMAVLHGFRLKRCSQGKMRSYKIICTDDANKSEEKWTTLIEINEKKKDEHEMFDVYQFHKPSPPAKYVRLIQTGPNWDNKLYLNFIHFDLFGDYLDA